MLQNYYDEIEIRKDGFSEILIIILARIFVSRD